MLTDNTNRAAHQESYAEQEPEQSPAVSSAFNLSIKPADDTRSSISSDKSDSKPPRSAMRRTSSISKLPQSPRRVRFDFMGEEVLPTSSPQQSVFIAARISSPEPADNGAGCASNLATDPGEDEEEPPPRKVSSSDALRALSRAPLDEDGTVWTVVNCDSEDFASGESQFTPSHQATAPDASPSTSATAISAEVDGEINTLTNDVCSKTTVSDTIAPVSNKPEDDSADDEDILSMARKKAPPSLVSSAPRVQFVLAPEEKEKAVSLEAGGKNSSPSHSAQAGRAESRQEGTSHSPPASDEREDGIFYFEGDGMESPEAALKPEPEEQEDSAPEEEHWDDGIDEVSDKGSVYATSLPITIPKQMMLVDTSGLMSSTLPLPKFQTGNVGSYKGRPLIMPIVRNPEVLENLDEDIADFEPSLDGRLDEQLAAMTASPPKSFKERLMIEDMMEAAEARRERSRVVQQ